MEIPFLHWKTSCTSSTCCCSFNPFSVICTHPCISAFKKKIMAMKHLIISPMATGNGAYILHKELKIRFLITIISYNPYRTLFPPYCYRWAVSAMPASFTQHRTTRSFHARRDVPLVVTFRQYYVLDRFMRDYSSRSQSIHYQTDLKIFTKLAVAKADVITAVSQSTADLVKMQ